jgi:hypothetical protein
MDTKGRVVNRSAMWITGLVCSIAGLVIAAAGWPESAQAEDGLRVLYTASSRGYVEPCG